MVVLVHADGYQKVPETKLVAACDVDEPKRQAFSEKWDVSRQYTDYGKMLGKEELDIVAVCTKDHQHPESTIEAAESGVKLSIDHSIRFEANYRKLLQITQNGEIGELRCIRFNTLGPTANRHFLLHNTHAFDALLCYAGADVLWLAAHVQEQERGETIIGNISFKNGVYATFEYGSGRNYHTYELILEGSDGTLFAIHGKRNSLDLHGEYSWKPLMRIWKKSDGGLTGFGGREPIETEKSNS